MRRSIYHSRRCSLLGDQRVQLNAKKVSADMISERGIKLVQHVESL
jgi:hypothetical protein